MEFKKLELENQPTGIKRFLTSPHVKKSVLYTVIGALGGFVFFYFTEGQHMDTILVEDIVRSTLIGAGFGLFITNSPCARNKC